jgi:hypothetical protein
MDVDSVSARIVAEITAAAEAVNAEGEGTGGINRMSVLRVGLVLRGYCNGYFGRDSYGDKRVEAFGVDWIVARDERGTPQFADLSGHRNVEPLIKEWVGVEAAAE